MIRITDVTSLWERIQEEVIKSKENGLVIEKEDGTTKELSGNPVDL